MAAEYLRWVGRLAGMAAVCLMLFGSTKELQVLAAEETDGWYQCAGVAHWLDTSEVLEDTTEEIINTAANILAMTDRTGELVMADVRNVLNVREAPGETSEKVGYLYADCGGTVLEQKDGWTKILSGELEGWASDEYLLFGNDAKKLAEDVGTTIARTTTSALRIRKAPSLDAGVYDLLEEGMEFEVIDADQLAFSDGIELSDEWIAVDFEGVTGFVSAEYIATEFVVPEGETLEQVKEREEAERAAALAAQRAAQQKEIERVKAMQSDDLTLMAALIQCEAGNQPYEGQVAVGAVVMNRVRSGAYPNTVKDVIFAAGQFTPVGSGRVGKLIANGNIKQSCINAAAEAMAGVSPVGGALHFRRAGGRDGLIIGNHVFW